MSYHEVFSNTVDFIFKFASVNSNMILPAFAAFSVIILLVGKLYYLIRIKFPIKVNCWFCNSCTSVPYNSANSWYCSHCDQYNGFCSDGSYNRILTEQFSEKLNLASWCVKSNQKDTSTNGLCRFCNINLELKVRQLAQFVPLNPANYDEEVTLYSEQLERVYRLCSRCQGVLEKTLIKKQELFLKNKHSPLKNLLNQSNTQMDFKQRHSLYLGVVAALSICLLLTTIPHSWLDQLVVAYPSADQACQLFLSVKIAVPPYVLPMVGAGVQLVDCVLMRNATSLVNMFLWIILICLPYAPVKVDHLDSIVQCFASIVFLITSITEGRNYQPRNLTANKPVQFQKLDEKPERPKSPKLSQPSPTNIPSYVSDSTLPVPDPPLSHKSTLDDLGFSKLNVSSRRVTRSQSKPFQAKTYAGKQNELFRPKPVNLSPPKLQLDKHFEYQAPLTRCSSQSSGFVSLSHQKDFEEDHPTSVINDNMESVSQCGRAMTPYHSPYPSSVPFPQYSPFSQFHPYAVVHYSPPPFNKVYSYANMSYYEPSLNLSSSTLTSQRTFENCWFHNVKNAFTSVLFVFLITSNIAILWKVFGQEYFKVET